MLVTSRKKGETLTLKLSDDRLVTLRILSIQGRYVRLGVIAPEEVAIRRGEDQHHHSPTPTPSPRT